MSIAKENLHTYKVVETFLESIWSDSAALFHFKGTVTRKLSYHNKNLLQPYVQKMLFPWIQMGGKPASIVLIKFWLNGMHFSFQDPQKADSSLFRISLNSKIVSKMLKLLRWLTLQSHRYKQENLSRYKFWSNHFCTLFSAALGFHPSHNFLFHTE